jgi:hypothetical protein
MKGKAHNSAICDKFSGRIRSAVRGFIEWFRSGPTLAFNKTLVGESVVARPFTPLKLKWKANRWRMKGLCGKERRRSTLLSQHEIPVAMATPKEQIRFLCILSGQKPVACCAGLILHLFTQVSDCLLSDCRQRRCQQSNLGSSQYACRTRGICCFSFVNKAG